MSQVTSPVILDSTGQDIVTQLAAISAAIAAGTVITSNTNTTLAGVLQGSNGKVAVKPVDASPTADSTNLVSSGGTKAALDTKASQGQLAYVENGTTASRAYAAGEYFCWHGLLYRAKTAIGNGDTFTVNTNCEQVSEGGLNALKSCLTWKSLGIAYYDTPLNTNFASYNELLITLLVNGSVQYGTYVIPVAHLSSTNSLFLSIYESQTHHVALQITTNSAKTQISLAYNGAIAGWNSVAASISAR